MNTRPTISDLAARQLDAYNRADLDAFCACYHPQVAVLDTDGQQTIHGIDAFRARYAQKFATGGFGATVPERLAVGPHCVDLEHYWVDSPTGERTEGTVLVRYTLRDQQIGTVQFLMP